MYIHVKNVINVPCAMPIYKSIFKKSQQTSFAYHQKALKALPID